MRLIEGLDDLAEGAAHLTRVSPVWANILPTLGDLPLRRCDDGFVAIRDAVVAQQISVAAAETISGRLVAAGLASEADIAAAALDDLRAVGLTRPKARYLQAIAAAQVDWASLRDLPDEAVSARLMALPGIGAWTADIYLLFALGRADAFAPGDLAMQEAARVLFDLDARPGAKALTQLAEPWRPWRSVAARALWSYYLEAKGRQGVR